MYRYMPDKTKKAKMDLIYSCFGSLIDNLAVEHGKLVLGEVRYWLIKNSNIYVLEIQYSLYTFLYLELSI